MKVKSIEFLYDWEHINVENDNIDVFVETDEGYTYVIVVGTPKNMEFLMKKEKMSYFGPWHPIILVKKLTKEIIEEAVKAYVEQSDGYWLKIYHWLGHIDKTVFDQLEAQEIPERKENMFLKEIRFPNSFEDIIDLENSNTEVFVKVVNGYTYRVLVGTPKNMEFLMDQKKMNYAEPGLPFLLVKKLTKEIIETALKDYAETNGGYWLKFYHFAGNIENSVFDQLKAKHLKFLKELEEEDDLDSYKS